MASSYALFFPFCGDSLWLPEATEGSGEDPADVPGSGEADAGVSVSCAGGCSCLVGAGVVTVAVAFVVVGTVGLTGVAEMEVDGAAATGSGEGVGDIVDVICRLWMLEVAELCRPRL